MSTYRKRRTLQLTKHYTYRQTVDTLSLAYKAMYKVIKTEIRGMYQVLDNNGDIVKEYDSYNDQKPFMLAKRVCEHLNSLSPDQTPDIEMIERVFNA